MRKLLLALVAFGILAGGLIVYAAPQYNLFRTIAPETDQTYYNGTSTDAWLQVNSQQFCLTGDSCITTWPSGGPGGGGSTTIASLTPNNGVFKLFSGNPSLLVATTSPGTITLTVATTTVQNLITGTAPINVSSGAVSLQGNFGSLNVTTSGYVNASTSILTSATTTTLDIGGLTSNGFVKTNGGTGNLSVDTNTYIQTGGQAGSVANAVTFNNSGSGAASGQTYNGSSAQTISYNTIGAQVAGTYLGNSNVSGASPQVGYFTGANTVNGSGNFLWNNGSSLLSIGGTINASSSNITNSTSTNLSGTNVYVVGKTAAFVAFDNNGQLISTTTPAGGGTPCVSTALSVQYNNAGGFGCTGWQYASGSSLFYGPVTLNATSSTFTNATTSLLTVTSIQGKVLATDPNGFVIATTSPAYLLTIGSGTTNNCVKWAGTNLLGDAGAPCGSGGGGAGGGWSTTTPDIIYNSFGGHIGINSSTPSANLVVQGLSGSSTPIFIVASSTNNSLLTVASNGSTTINSLVSGVVQSTAGGQLYNVPASTYQLALTNPDTGTGASPQVAVWNGATALTGYGGFLWDNSNTRLVVAGTINASSSNITNATSTNITANNYYVTGLNGRLLATDGNGFITSTTSYITLGSLSGTAPISYNSGTGAISLTNPLAVQYGGTGQSILTSNYILYGNGTNPVATSTNLLYQNSTLFASSSQFTNTTSTQLSLNGIYYSWPAAQGASSTALETNGSGLLSWATLSSGGTPCTTTGNSLQYNNNGSFGCAADLLTNGTVTGVNATSSTIAFNLQGNAGTYDPFNVASSSTTSYLRVTQAGNIGINTTTPIDQLVIQGNSGQSNNYFSIASSSGATTFSVAPSGVSGTLILGTTNNTSNPGCIEMGDSASSTIGQIYVYASNATLVSTTTKPSFCP